MTPLTRARIAELVAMRLGDHVERDEEPDCPACNSSFTIDTGDEPTRVCHGCAQGICADDVPQLLAAAQLVVSIAERRCECDDIATGDFGDRCDSCRARALVKL